MIAGALLLAVPTTLYAQPGARPNIVVIMIDDEDVASLDMMVARGLMPNLKQLLLDPGIEFTRAFAVGAFAAPSRATFLTGQYPHNHREIGTSPWFGGVPKFNESSTVATWLRSAGYRTGLAGRYITGYGVHTTPTSVPPGWDAWAGLVEYAGWSMSLYKVSLNGTVVDFGALASQAGVELYQTDILAYLAGEFIRTAPAYNKPFFLWVTPVAFNREVWPGPTIVNECPDPGSILYPIFGGGWWGVSQAVPLRHRNTLFGDSSFPLPQTPSFNEEDVSDKPNWIRQTPPMSAENIDCLQKRYWRRLEVLRTVDDMVGYLMAQLAATGALANTVVIFTADNGLLDGQHRFPDKSAAYEEAIRVPLVIRMPGAGAGPQQIDRMVLNMDLAPTIAQLAQATPAHTVDGRSLVALMANPALAWRQMALFEHVGGGLVAADVSVMGFLWPTDYTALRSETRKFVQYARDSSEFYDLTIDPYELANLFGDPARSVEINIYTQVLNAMKTCRGALCQAIENLVLH
jgi:arylsulfatase A-like enzyme